MSPAASPGMDDAGRANLAAADTLFCQGGIAGVGVEDVRDAAGVSLRRICGAVRLEA